MELRVPELSVHLKNLLKGEIANFWMQVTIEKLNKLMTSDAMPVMADGGQIRDGFLTELVPQSWQKIAAEFLLTGDENPLS
jgi:hypothetical protein